MPDPPQPIRSSAAEYLTYAASVGEEPSSVEMGYQDENIRLTQKMMPALYGLSDVTINEYIKKIFKDSEIEELGTIRNFRIVQQEGTREVSLELKHYSHPDLMLKPSSKVSYHPRPTRCRLFL